MHDFLENFSLKWLEKVKFYKLVIKMFGGKTNKNLHKQGTLNKGDPNGQIKNFELNFFHIVLIKKIKYYSQPL